MLIASTLGGPQLTARGWHATATEDGAEAYRRHFTESVLPALQGVAGHHGVYLLRRDRDDHVELDDGFARAGPKRRQRPAV